MNIAQIKNLDIANGPGCRVSVFVSGCTRMCKGCFNAVAWDFDYGEQFDDETIIKIINLMLNPRISGLSVLGGEPFEPKNQKDVLLLMRSVKQSVPDKDIWCFTGYTFEQILYSGITTPYTDEMLRLIDVLVDGPFILEQKNLALKFRGSTNQRIIDVQGSLRQGKAISWEDKYDKS
jgi:anaerobic ribonucleoside-triphosphate reductase activating protein